MQATTHYKKSFLSHLYAPVSLSTRLQPKFDSHSVLRSSTFFAKCLILWPRPFWFFICHAIRLRDGWIIFIPAGQRFNLAQKKVLALFVRCFKPCGGSGAAAKCFLCVPFRQLLPPRPPRAVVGHTGHTKGTLKRTEYRTHFKKALSKDSPRVPPFAHQQHGQPANSL